jgi:26S proteasome regulatory subunit T5
MNVSADVNYEELARCTDDFNGAQLKVCLVDCEREICMLTSVTLVQAVCIEAGMNALRREAVQMVHEDFMEGIAAVQAKKKKSLQYFA